MINSRQNDIPKTVFVSYSSKDAETVSRVLKVLDEIDVAYWKAPEMIPAGSNYAREIPTAIEGCQIFLLLLSKVAQESIWVEKEVDTAVCNRKVIIPIQLDNEPLNSMYRFYLNNVQMIMAGNNWDMAMEELKKQISLLLGLEPDSRRVGQAERIGNALRNKKNAALKNESDRKTVDDEYSVLKLGGSEESAANKNTDSAAERHRKKRADAFSWNPEPTECEHCGGEVYREDKGVYRCKSCGKHTYDYYYKVRNYLEKNGSAPAVIIAKETGVPRKVIDNFFRDEYLEIPSFSTIRLSCARCGAPIRTGTLCDKCKLITPASSTEPRGEWRSSVVKRRR